jgi:eukaryotic-like serine/threonine-protein kinase
MPVGDAGPPTDDPLIGRVLSERYRVLRKVGRGGVGTVYQAEHALIEKKIALKVLFPELARRPELVARFLHEAKSASRIGHENVIDISDFGQSPEGLAYIAMELLDGKDLAKRLAADGPLSWPRARSILMQIVKALRAAHEHGIIHRDVKPENVFLVPREGRSDFIKVLDFGISKVLDDAEGPGRVRPGMPPELAQGQAVDHRVDVYAVGCLMYRMLTGAAPSDARPATAGARAPELPVAPRELRPDLQIAADVEAVCLRALEIDREKRWQDMDALYRALGAAGGEAFEPSGAYVPYANLPFSSLPEASVTGRALKVEPSFEPAPPPSDDEPAIVRSSAGFKLGVVIAGMVVVAALLMQMLHQSRPAATAVPAPAASAPAAPAAAKTPSAAP